jgi:glucosamine--fructose-6-phosphate aminotransferase (isomerizing)
VAPMLLEGLRRLEYRGYDSCGIATVTDAGLRRARSVARVSELADQVSREHLAGETGIAHTRWATHGAPDVCNAHPLVSRGHIAVVHNGIIENFEEIRSELIAKGYEFTSQTDTEVIAHLINDCDKGDLLEAVMCAARRLRGSYAIAVLASDEPHRIVAARQGSPLVVGIGRGENMVASDAMAVAGIAERVAYIKEGDVVDITPETWQVYERTADGNFVPAKRETHAVTAYAGAVELGPYRHFMQKEIFEQPRAVSDTLEGVAGIAPTLFGKGAEEVFSKVHRLLFVACGTSYYAAMTAKYWIEELAGIPVDVEIASEYRYRVSVPDPATLVVTVSQSGETADTLAALRHAKELGMPHSLTICNVATSAMVAESELAYITRAGVEIGVASTKAFTTQLTAIYLLGLVLAKMHGRLTPEQEAKELTDLRHLPAQMRAVLALEPQIIAWAERFAQKQHALFLGRGAHYPIALEGALKLKEISYIHAEGYPAGELKHGPLALVDRDMPVVTVAPNDRLLEKLKSNMQEVRARGGELYVCADSGSKIEMTEGMHVLRMPEHFGRLSPILHVVALQLLAYHTAVARGTDVDKPRNLAKSVTVE